MTIIVPGKARGRSMAAPYQEEQRRRGQKRGRACYGHLYPICYGYRFQNMDCNGKIINIYLYFVFQYDVQNIYQMLRL